VAVEPDDEMSCSLSPDDFGAGLSRSAIAGGSAGKCATINALLAGQGPSAHAAVVAVNTAWF
jgi:hypothetical protein